jgi:hypothetical protein
MFPCGWPGGALLLLRLGIVAVLTQDGILAWMGALQREPISLLIVAAIAGVFLRLGLWTPIAGAIVALSEIGIVLTGYAESHSNSALSAVLLYKSLPGGWPQRPPQPPKDGPP